MNKMNLTCLIITIIALITSIVALALGIIAVTDKNDTKIAGAYEIGLGDLLDGNVVQMTYVGYEPGHIVDFTDEEFLTNLREALRTATYQKTKSTFKRVYYKIGSGPGDYIRIKTENSLYSISAIQSISITKDGVPNAYNSNVSSIVQRLIYQEFIKLFK